MVAEAIRLPIVQMKMSTNSTPPRADLFARIGEVIFFGAALFLLLPPVSSVAGHQYHFSPLGVIAVGCFCLSRAMSVWREKAGITWAALQSATFFAFAFFAYQRLQMG